jgi:hypothetical protein
VRRQPGGGLELPREMVGIEANDRGQLRHFLRAYGSLTQKTSISGWS